MKVKCIDNENKNSKLNLTIGDFYEVKNIVYLDGKCYYRIDNDITATCKYKANRFISISEIRNDKINKLLSNDES